MHSATSDDKSRRKRAPVTGTLVGVRLQPEALAALDAWRETQPDLPGRPEAIRRLLESAIKRKT